MPVVGSRFLIEAGFIIAVAVIAGIERLSTWWIIAVVAGAWIIVAIVEIVVWAQAGVAAPPSREAFEPLAEEPTFVAPVRVASSRVSRVERRSRVGARARAAAPSPEPSRIAAVPSPPRAGTRAGAGAVSARGRLHSRERGPEGVESVGAGAGRAGHATDDLVRNEERSYLLMYLREFAGPDGILPTDFDGLVRDAFGDVLHTVGA